ncbi:MAG: sigma-70 family RNA polymerase sigma factor [Planctomycetota bacterium]
MPEMIAETDPDTQRCAELFRQRAARVHALAARLLGPDAEDAVQDVFVAALRSLPGFRGEAKLTTWFHRLAIRVLCAYRRRRDRRAEREVADPDAEQRLSPQALARLQQRPLDRLAAAERKERVLGAIERLSPPLREVLLLRGEHLSYAEIAAALELPLGTVKSRLAAATVQLAERLAAHAEEIR